jgi:hypothetical protein
MKSKKLSKKTEEKKKLNYIKLDRKKMQIEGEISVLWGI